MRQSRGRGPCLRRRSRHRSTLNGRVDRSCSTHFEVDVPRLLDRNLHRGVEPCSPPDLTAEWTWPIPGPRFQTQITRKPRAVTIEDALARFLIQLNADGRSVHTIGQYRRHVRLLAAWCAHVGHCGAVDSLTHEDVARFLASRHAQTQRDTRAKKATTVNALRSSLRGFFRYLHAAGHISENPSRLTRRALCAPPPPNGLSADEETRLLGVLSQAEGSAATRDHALFHLMLATGIRLSSAIALDREDVDIERVEIAVRSTKGNRPDRVFFGTAIREHLATYMSDRAPGPLFTTLNGQRISRRQAQRRFAYWLGKAGITRAASPHSCRHAFALGLYRRSGDILLVKEALHHRSITSTLVYARADEERLRRALE